MNHTYKIDGMTCQGCVASVTRSLESIEGVSNVLVNLNDEKATFSSSKALTVDDLQSKLPKKFSISVMDGIPSILTENDKAQKSKLVQLKPLLLILFYISVASVLLNWNQFEIQDMMLDFMGLFFIVFSFFKMLDIKGFSKSFSMYDPLASMFSGYGFVYPFLETVLGLMFLFRYQIPVALIITILVLGITTIGVTKTLLSKRSIKCACLGSVLNLPMTEATFIENAIMIIMSIFMLLGYYF